MEEFWTLMVKGVGGLEKLKIFMDATCASSLALKLDLAILKDVIFVTNGIKEPVIKAKHKYQRYPSLLVIKENYKDLNFPFFQSKFIQFTK